MKKIFSFLLFVIYLVSNFSSFVFAEGKENYFIVTAYYSPLPNQNFYLKGNYEDELTLNGNGITGASGKSVFSGMLAAPLTYKFGTKIYIDGIGIGSVEDRGGAIVNAGKRGYEYDRIDVWMGYGDEGLRRALFWGKRKVIGNVVATNEITSINLDNISSPIWATQNIKKISNIFNIGLGKDSNKQLITKLQEFLTEINLYNGKIDGIYNKDIIDLIYNFQIENAIINTEDSCGAGYWGNSTRNLFLKKYLNGEFDISVNSTDSFENKNIINNSKENLNNNIINNSKENLNNNIINNSKENLNNNIVNNSNIEIFESFSKTNNDIKKLQNILIELSLYKGDSNGKYKDIIDTIFDFQVSNGILKNTFDVGAGSYGPKTRTALKNYYELYKDNQEEIRIKDLKIQEEIRIKDLKIQEEKILQEQRQKQLEEKFKKLDEMANKKVEDKISIIGNPKFGDISAEVRELQLLLKQLGYFKYKDTAIYGDITKQSVLLFQIDNKLVNNENDIGAGMIGPVTKGKIKEILKNNILDELLISEKLDKNELVDIGILEL